MTQDGEGEGDTKAGKGVIATLMRRITGADANLQEVLRGAGLAVILRAFGAGFAFLLNVAIGRLLGAEGAGYYYLALAVSSIGAVIARLGMDNALLRFIASGAATDNWSEIKGVYSLGSRLAFLTSLSLAIAVIIAAPWMSEVLFEEPDLVGPLRWISLSICSFALLMLTAESLKGLRLLRDSMLVSGVLYPVVALVLVWPLTRLMGPSGAALAYVLGTAAATLFGYLVWRRAIAPHADAPPSFEAKTLWASANKLWVMSIINSALLPWTPLFLLGVWGTAADTGVLGAAVRISTLVAIFLTAVNTVSAPKFAQMHVKGDMRGLARLARRFALIIALVSSPILGLMIFGSSWVMGLFGPEFVSGGVALTIIALGQAVNAATGSVGYLLMMTGHERDIRNTSLLAAFIMIVCSVTLIPAYGLIGAAISSASAVASMNIINVVFVRLRLGFWVVPR